MPIDRAFPTLFVADLARARAFWCELLGWHPAWDSDWYVHLSATPEGPPELGLLRRDHELVPEERRLAPQGAMVTVVVDDVDAVFAAATDRGVQVVEPPRNLFYGQRRMLITDPDGHLIDVSTPCPPDPEWEAEQQRR
ncbi:MAG: VOC family protein [Myxococcota bacterium]